MLGELLGLERGLIEAGLEAGLDTGFDTGPDAKRTIRLGEQSGRVDRWEQGVRKSGRLRGAKDGGTVSRMHGYDRRCGGMGVSLAWDTPRGSGTVKNPKNIWKKYWVMFCTGCPPDKKSCVPKLDFFTGANAPE